MPLNEANRKPDEEQKDIIDNNGEASSLPPPALEDDDRALMTAVVNRAERAGKPVKPVVLLTDDSVGTVLAAARDIGAGELILGARGTESPSDQLDRVVTRWREIDSSRLDRMTIRMIGDGIDITGNIHGGSRVAPAADDNGETARAVTGSEPA